MSKAKSKNFRERGHAERQAINSPIQGSAADLMKLKLVALHEARTGLLMRCTVHDEVDGDVPDAESAARVAAVLDAQSVPLRVPITWDVGTGATWGDV